MNYRLVTLLICIFVLSTHIAWAQTVTVKPSLLTLNPGETATVAVVLDKAALATYNITVRLEGVCGVKIKAVSFANTFRFTGLSTSANIDSDGRAVPLIAFASQIITGNNLILGEVTLQGESAGLCEIILEVNIGDMDAQSGILKISDRPSIIDETAPTISNPQPEPDRVVKGTQPAIAVTINDDTAGAGVDISTVAMRITDTSLETYTFTPTDVGASFVAGRFVVDLEAADIVLRDGAVTVTVTAADAQGNEAQPFTFEFEVRSIVPGDLSGDGVLSSADVNMARLFVLGFRGLAEEQLQAGDVAAECTGGETMTIGDVVALQQAVAGAITEFECFPGRAVAVAAASKDEALSVQNVLARSTLDGFEFHALGSGISAIQVQIFSLSGQRVFGSNLQPGNRLRWHRLSDEGQPVANGVYLYTVTVQGGGITISSQIKKLVVLK